MLSMDQGCSMKVIYMRLGWSKLWKHKYVAWGSGPDVHGLYSCYNCPFSLNLWPHRELLMINKLKKILYLCFTDSSKCYTITIKKYIAAALYSLFPDGPERLQWMEIIRLAGYGAVLRRDGKSCRFISVHRLLMVWLAVHGLGKNINGKLVTRKAGE